MDKPEAGYVIEGAQAVFDHVEPEDRCQRPIPHVEHRHEGLTRGGTFFGYRCDGQGGVVIPPEEAENLRRSEVMSESMREWGK